MRTGPEIARVNAVVIGAGAGGLTVAHGLARAADSEAPVKVAGIDGMTRKQRPQFIETSVELIEAYEQEACNMRRISLRRNWNTVIDREMVEVRQNSDRQAGGVAIPTGLKSRFAAVINGNAWLLGLDKQLTLSR